ncbi:DMT family transporter [Desulfosarcina sp.]|uniref:DMT family transporter n=1 Tax=Desulfosarcina sp. TaxID=2027861 RepID=UPI0029A99C9C|nr:DMT family transporter [Desulfosarcina sp.]MDX2452750.1 DMT family transporter [Desulfosarcina sp.]MDX2490501.1 DMT family transporter [Desulfosarcina sp.]
MKASPKSKLPVFLMVAVAPMCWAGNIVLAKGVAELIPPVSLAFWRWMVAFMVLLPLTWPYVKRDWKTALAGWKILGLLALFGVTIFNTLLYTAMHTTTAINGALIQTTMPAVIIVISLILYGERVSGIQAAGVMLCVVGAGVVVLKGRWQALIDLALAQGDLLMIVAVVLYALYSALLPKRPNMHPMSFLTYTFGLGCLGLLPLYLWEISAVGTFTLTPGVAGSIGYVALFPSIVAYFCWNRGVAVIGANRTGLFINLIPVFAAILAILFLGESLKSFHLAGMALILAGFVMFNR